jgi:hypothetical protein
MWVRKAQITLIDIILFENAYLVHGHRRGMYLIKMYFMNKAFLFLFARTGSLLLLQQYGRSKRLT